MDILALSLLGGLLAWDGTSFGQFMFSRPLVAATAVGWVLGDVQTGLLMGSALELLHLSVIPVGGARFPEVGPASVAAAATAVSAGGAVGIALGCLLALVWGQLGGTSIVWLRRLNGRLAPEPFSHPVTPASAEWRHLAATALDLARGTVLTGLGILVGVKVAAPAIAHWPLGPDGTMGLLLAAAGVPAGALLRSLGGVRRRAAVLGLGVALGGAAGWLVL